MEFEPKKITKEHILQGVDKIREKQPELSPSTRWDVLINGENYPPKEIMRYAHKEMNGYYTWNYGGGEATNKWLKQFDFKIIDKSKKGNPILDLIKRYKFHAKKSQLKDELYKWKHAKTYSGSPDIYAANFIKEFKQINYHNLIDVPRSYLVAKEIVEKHPDDFKTAFKILFNDKENLQNRINNFAKLSKDIYSKISPLPHHQDERTMATYLAYYDSNKYAFFKDSFYQKFCKLINVPSKKAGEKLVHYYKLLDDFIENYIKVDEELLLLKKRFLTEDCFEDTNHKIFAQDILYTTLDQQKGLGRSYWRVGTSDDETSFWDLMKVNQCISIGWSELGDLSEQDVQNKKGVIELLEYQGFYPEDNRTKSRKAGEIFNFYNDIKEGDVILAQSGQNILGIGEVNGDYGYDSSKKFSHFKPVQWKLIAPTLKNKEGNQTTVFKLSNPNTIHQIDNLLKEDKKDQNMETELNQILFGPPGTGKTYNTINKALEICGIDLNGLSREQIKYRFEKLVDEGTVVFTTFHQSMSYEDFVEGIKPVAPENEGDHLIYKVEEGIFRKICIEAAFSIAKEKESFETENVLDFSLAFNNFVERIEEKIACEETIELKTKNGGKVIVDGISQQGNIIIKHPGKDNTYPVSKQRLSKLHTAFPDLMEVSNIDQQFRSVIGGSNSTANWAVLNAIKISNSVSFQTKQTNDQYSWEDKTEVVKTLKKEDYKDNSGAPFVLIIDEINRGNVSQIFGELITLIEEDKRLGNPEAIQVQLPYSKDWFGVPPNVHIIGTMNTADRSVEALDTALRRRFSFTEMPPKPELLIEVDKLKDFENIEVELILNTINRRIEKLIDKDHKIGHSYFLKIQNINDLKTIFRDKVIPLLEEYFFGDYGKIGLVLGNSFIRKTKNEEISFAVFNNYDDSIVSDLKERAVYVMKNADEWDFKSIYQK